MALRQVRREPHFRQSVNNLLERARGVVSVAAGPVGAGAEATTTTNVGADIYQYGYSQRVYGGMKRSREAFSTRRTSGTKPTTKARRFGQPSG